jgi:hypothetical protein
MVCCEDSFTLHLSIILQRTVFVFYCYVISIQEKTIGGGIKVTELWFS